MATKKTTKAKRKPAPKKLKPGEVFIYAVSGKKTKGVPLPEVFHTPLRHDLIRRDVVAAQANRRQPYGPGKWSGRRHSVEWAGKGRGASRVPRLKSGSMEGAEAPGTRGGARAHPPKPARDWSKKVNAKERRRARASALAAVGDTDVVRARGHRFDGKVSLPLVVEDTVEKLETTSEALALLENLGLSEDLARVRAGIHVRAGRGKMRGRRKRHPVGPLIVLKDSDTARRAFRNLPGVDVRVVSRLDTEVLAPGGDPGRLTVFSHAALEELRGWS